MTVRRERDKSTWNVGEICSQGSKAWRKAGAAAQLAQEKPDKLESSANEEGATKKKKKNPATTQD